LRLLEQGSGVGGARPKCTVELEDALWIAKFPAKGDTVNFSRIEHATMALAKQCGITVPEMRLVAIGGRDVLLVKRFDREKIDDGYLRYGFLSALSLMEWDERDRTMWDYPTLADRMRATILAQPEQSCFGEWYLTSCAGIRTITPANTHFYGASGDLHFRRPMISSRPRPGQESAPIFSSRCPLAGKEEWDKLLLVAYWAK
jgi:serine/threonine-protein kinase HipA